jgi:hypothetical protein
MARARTQPATRIMDPILLWILIHGGDPAPDAATQRLSAALAIHSLAGSLGAVARKEVQAAVTKEIGQAAGEFGR